MISVYARGMWAIVGLLFAVSAGNSGELGPVAAKGLILFTTATDSPIAAPPYLELMREDGWDVALNPIKINFNAERGLAADLRRRMDEAKGQGYRKVALIGESFGAWISLMANSSFQTPLDGPHLPVLIAIDASAAAAPGSASSPWHDYKFIDLLKTQDPTRMALFLYDAPEDEREERRAEVVHSLTNPNAIAYVAVGKGRFNDANGPHGEAFVRRYGACLIALLDVVGGSLPPTCSND